MKYLDPLTALLSVSTFAFSIATASADCQCQPGAELPRVTEGTFSLQVGHSVELTNSGLMLTFHSLFRLYSDAKPEYIMLINGEEFSVGVGTRFDLKKRSTRLKDRDECWLDLYRIVEAKGAPLTASFRLDCP